MELTKADVSGKRKEKRMEFSVPKINITLNPRELSLLQAGCIIISNACNESLLKNKLQELLAPYISLDDCEEICSLFGEIENISID